MNEHANLPDEMSEYRAHVKNGKVVLDDAVQLPEGAEVRVTIVDAESDMSAEARARLHAALEAGLSDVEAGRTVSSEALRQRLRDRHGG